ncbi:MAG: hypothetical protein HPY74_12060 [Firmicutes bacterium]|nr:hypothetical protein [Bacillota bacterium]
MDIPLLEECLGMSIVPTSARKGRGIHELMEKAWKRH